MSHPVYDPAYDPVEHLTELGYTIRKHTLRDSYAICIPERRLILEDRNMPSVLRKPVLTHEARHVVNGDPGGHHPRYEERADLEAALTLTNPVEWDVLTRIHPDYDRICHELGITRAQFRALVAHKRRERKEALSLERIGQCVYLGPRMGAGQYVARFQAVG